MRHDKETVTALGESRKLHFQDWLRRQEQAQTDAKKKIRRAVRECKWCFYVNWGMSGQAFTAFICEACAEESNHPNTAVPKLCNACADKLGACVRCCGSREWKREAGDGKGE